MPEFSPGSRLELHFPAGIPSTAGIPPGKRKYISAGIFFGKIPAGFSPGNGRRDSRRETKVISPGNPLPGGIASSTLAGIFSWQDPGGILAGTGFPSGNESNPAGKSNSRRDPVSRRDSRRPFYMGRANHERARHLKTKKNKRPQSREGDTGPLTWNAHVLNSQS